jgi:hypothetical protein
VATVVAKSTSPRWFVLLDRGLDAEECMSSLSGTSQGVPENSQEPGPHQQNVEGVPAARSSLLNFDEARLVQHFHAGE